jgi:hypothetical protein
MSAFLIKSSWSLSRHSGIGLEAMREIVKEPK